MRTKFWGFHLCLTLSLLLTSCGGDSSTSPAPTQQGPIHTDINKSASKTIGPDGGSITTTGSNGIQYTLEVPAGALIAGTKITVTPVSSIDDLGLDGGLAGAVVLQPSGLEFAYPAILHITTTKTAGDGQRLQAFSSNGDFSARALGFAASNGDEVEVMVSHFSAAGAGFGTEENLSSFATPSSDVMASFINDLFEIPVPWSTVDIAQATQTGHDVFSQVVLPELQGAGTDAELIQALADYNGWRSILDVIDATGVVDVNFLAGIHNTPTEYVDDINQALEAAAQAILDAISSNSFVCEAHESITALGNVLFWQKQAQLLGIDTVANHLDRQTILNNLCAHVIVDSGSLPANLQVGFPHSLDLDFGLQFNGSSGSIDAPFFVEVTGVGLNIQSPQGFSDSHGKYTTVITATQAGGVSFFATASLVLPGTKVGSDVQGFASDGAGSTDVSGDWAGPESGTLEGNSPLEWAVRVHLEQNQNAISGTVTECHILPGATISATLTGTQLLNVTVEFSGDGATCIAHGSGTVNGNSMTITVDDPECNGGLHWVMNLTKDAFVQCPQ